MERINPAEALKPQTNTPANTTISDVPDDRLRIRLAGCGVPPRYLGARVTDFTKIPEMNDCGLFLHGTSGTGKTHLATAIMAEKLPELAHLDEYGRWVILVRWVSVPELLLELRATFGNSVGPTEKSILANHSACDLLILDDLGAEKVTDWTCQSVYLLVSRRINECKQTIVTSNLNIREIHDKVDPRLADRLAGMTIHEMTGKSWRIKAKSKREG